MPKNTNIESKKYNIILIEDDKNQTDFITSVLNNEIFDVKVFHQGKQAIPYLESPEIFPDAILIENKLPDVEGTEIIEYFEKKGFGYAFIILTSNNSMDSVAKALNAGALDYITKNTGLKDELAIIIEKTINSNRERIEKKNLEKKLKESEEKFEAIFEDDKSIKLMIDPQTGNIMDANKAATDFYGYDLDVLTSMNISQINSMPEEKIAERIQKTIAKELNHHVFQHKIASGEIKDVEVYSTPIVINNEKVIFSIIHDISDRKRAEQELIESEKKLKTLNSELLGLNKKYKKTNELLYEQNEDLNLYKSLIENSGDPVFMVDDETARMIYVNKAAKKHYGASYKEIYSWIVPDWDPNFTHENFKEQLEPVLIEKHITIESMHKVKGGKIVPVEITVNQIDYKNRSCHYGFFHNIEERKKLELALKESEEKYRLLFENLTHGFSLQEVITDENGEAVDFRFLEVNSYYESFGGLKPSQVKGKTFKEMMPDADIDVIRRFCNVGLTKIPLTTEYFSQSYGKYVKVHTYSPMYKQFASIYEDITERKNAELKLNEMYQQLQTIFKTIPAAINIFDTDLNVIECNDEMLKLFNVKDKTEVIGKKCVFNCTLDHTSCKCLKTQLTKSFEGLDIRITEPNEYNDGRIYKIFSSPIKIDDHKSIGVVEIIVDITDEKLKEQELKELNATKDRLFSIIGHDLRGPIGGLKSLMELLLSSYDFTDVQKLTEILQIMQMSAASTYDLLENLLLWAKSQRNDIAFKPEKVDLFGLCEKTITLMSEKILLKNININNQVLPNQFILADFNMINTIIRNLLSNAIKFTPENKDVCISAIEKADNILISIEDEGVGIKEEDLPKLFNSKVNHTTYGTNGEEGSGLGLLLCKEFVEKHGTKIWVESEVGKGSDFKFMMPLYHN